MTAGIEETVQFSIGLDTVIGEDREYDHDGDFAGTTPITLGQMVARLVADNITRSISADARREYGAPVRDRVNGIADKLVEEKYRDVLDREILPTDAYGQPKGAATTLAELIATRAGQWLGEKRGGDSYGRGQKSNLQHLIDEAVGRTFKSEVQKAVKDAQAAAVAEVSKQAADVFAEIIRRSAS